MHPADPRVALLRDQLVGYVLHGTDGIRFHLRQLIGEGGQGWVYKGNYDEPDGLSVVIKVLRPDGVTDETLRRFRREADVFRQLGAQANPNPNLVRFYDHGIVQFGPPDSSPLDRVALPFTVLEYVHGTTLAQLILDQQGIGLPPGRTRRLLRQVAFALGSVHAQNIVHRDLKPSNILVALDHGTEVVKVTDFGLAKLVDFNAQKTTMLAGASIGYAPPEQYEKGNERVTLRTDVFSFAAILFECLTATPAFVYRPGDSPLRLIREMIAGPRPTLVACAQALAVGLRDNQRILAELDAHLKRALQANPDDRPSSIREFWDSVDPLLVAVSDASARPPAPIPLVHRQKPRESVNPPVEGSSVRYAFRARGVLPYQDELRAAFVTPDSSAVFALGTLAIYHWQGSTWARVPSPAWLDLAMWHGIALLPDSALLLFGCGGTVVILKVNGEARSWQLADDDLDLRGARVDQSGFVLVGRRRSAAKGAFVQAMFGRQAVARTIETTSTLTGVTRLATGALIACGEDGALARIDVPEAPAIPWGRTGHLLAIASHPDGGAVVVGSGGHALALSATLQVTLESVETTRDLVSVSVAKDGTAWAGATHGRLLRRRGTIWTRIPLAPEQDDKSVIICVKPRQDGSLLIVVNDGQVLEGRSTT